ncbi:glycosyltransferase family 39 protein [Elusimicrobiota bacterium]
MKQHKSNIGIRVANRKKNVLFVILLCLVFSLICISSYIKKSPTYDEVQHLSAGYALLKTGEFDIGIGHPHLFRYIIGLPVLFMDPAYPEAHPLFQRKLSNDPRKWSMMQDYSFAEEFFYNSGNNPDRLFFWGRFFSVLIGVCLAIVIYLFSSDLFGSSAGIFSLFLYCFSPTIIAHSRLAVNDVAGAAAIIFALFMTHCYMKKNSIKNFLMLIFATSIALLTKYNAVILIPFTLVIMILTDGKKSLIKYLFFLGAVIFIIDLTYAFSGVFHVKELNYEVFCELIPFNIFDKPLYLFYKYLPLPDAYLKSFVRLLMHNIRGHSTFLAGRYSTQGWWYYFPLAFLFKTPVLTLLLFALWIMNMLMVRKASRGELLLISFFVIYWIMSIRSTINIGHRHILPVYPVLFILFARLYNTYADYVKKKILRYGFIIVYILSTQIYFPHYLPYFNCIIRPENGYRYFADSSLDWGQDLPGLKQFLRKEGSPAVIILYWGKASLKHYGIEHQAIFLNKDNYSHINASGVKKEYLAISATSLLEVYSAQRNVFMWLRDKKPYKKIGFSIFVYDITEDAQSAAVLGEIYIAQRALRHAVRQYERLILISEDNKIKQWASNRLKELKVQIK